MPELCDNSCVFGKVLHDTQIVMAAQEAAVWNAAVQSEHVIALLAAPAGRGCKLHEAEVVSAPCSAWDVQEEHVLRRFCSAMNSSEVTRLHARLPTRLPACCRSRSGGICRALACICRALYIRVR